GYGDQIHGLKSGVQVVVGTPGRVVDHINKGTLQLDGLQTLVLDEADEMISMGFKEDLETVLQAAPKDQANIWLFSATMSPEVRGVADAYLTEPQKVQVNRTEMLPSTVEQVYFMIHEYDKPQLVTTLIDAADDFYGIIFCQTKSLVADLTQFLKDKGYTADALHGDIDQTGRDRVMKNFRDRKVTVLVATDVACRGLDVKDITHVVNYSIPRELDNYVHRIGRTGRSGKSGKAFSLVTRSHRELIGRIERMTKSRMTEGTIPSLKDIAIKKLVKAKEKFVTAGPQGRLTDLLGATWADVIETLTKEEITARFLAMLNPVLAPAKASDKEEVQVRAPAEPGRGGGGGAR
ncbi:MAG: DEAD/DEAH box helicase, partial [Proteobacteria bacterium]